MSDDLKCSYCHNNIHNIKNELVVCNKCGGLHHQECWLENNGKCSVYGCDSTEYHGLCDPVAKSVNITPQPHRQETISIPEPIVILEPVNIDNNQINNESTYNSNSQSNYYNSSASNVNTQDDYHNKEIKSCLHFFLIGLSIFIIIGVFAYFDNKSNTDIANDNNEISSPKGTTETSNNSSNVIQREEAPKKTITLEHKIIVTESLTQLDISEGPKEFKWDLTNYYGDISYEIFNNTIDLIMINQSINGNLKIIPLAEGNASFRIKITNPTLDISNNPRTFYIKVIDSNKPKIVMKKQLTSLRVGEEKELSFDLDNQENDRFCRVLGYSDNISVESYNNKFYVYGITEGWATIDLMCETFYRGKSIEVKRTIKFKVSRND